MTIPSGAAFVSIPIQTKSNALKDGNRQVSIQAKAVGVTQGIVWVTVTDINKPDLLITAVTLPEKSVSVSGSFQFVAHVANVGYSTVRSGVQLKGYLSEDIYLDESDDLLGEYTIDATIPSGDTIIVTSLATAPIIPQTYYLLFEVNPFEEVDEILFLNNTSTAVPINVLSDYTGTAVVADSVFTQGQLVPIQGTARRANGSLVPNVDLTVFVSSGAINREFPVKTDTSGNYLVNFLPLPKEAGQFTVSIKTPSQQEATNQDEFDIPGVRINNDANLTWTLILDDTLQGKLGIENLSRYPLPEFTIRPVLLPSGASLVFDTLSVLAGSTTDSLNYTISGTELSTRNQFDVFTLASKTNGKTLQRQKAYYLCQSLQGHLENKY